MKPLVIRVKSWSKLHDALYHDSWAEDLHRYRSSYVYRGLADRAYDLSTTLNRLGESHLERHLLRNFIKYSQRSDSPRNLWFWLALGQHHGLPTRLLDWTYSPLVALHFATSDFTKYDRDGMIWAVDYVNSVNYLPNKLGAIIKAEGAHVFTAELLDQAVESLRDLESLQAEPFVVFFEPRSLDERIVNQHALFSMMSRPEVILSSWLQRPQVEVKHFQIIIPATLKWEIRDKLDQANVNERMLFPGLDGLATWLTRHYKDIRPKRAAAKCGAE
jgi:FRG domain